MQQQAHHRVGLDETPLRSIRNVADVLRSRNLKMHLTLHLDLMQTKLSEAAFSAVFSNFKKCRLEEADADVAVDYVGMDVRVKFCDSLF